MGDSGTREARPKGVMGRRERKEKVSRLSSFPSPLAFPSAAHLSLILIGERETTGDESAAVRHDRACRCVHL